MNDERRYQDWKKAHRPINYLRRLHILIIGGVLLAAVIAGGITVVTMNVTGCAVSIGESGEGC